MPPDVCKGDPAMPSPMIYQDLTTAALLGHAAQYHSETEIVSVSTGGEKERSCWGEVASRAQRLASALQQQAIV
ncbi:long-chain fatty acid--CoA ligase, partial [Klebsiella pneumoniae]